MAILDILVYPDERLLQKAPAVDLGDPGLAELVSDMTETMYHANGVGLAATQVGVFKRVAVIDVSDERDQVQVFLNPTIKQGSDEVLAQQEGCLSIPGVYDLIERHTSVVVEAYDLDGKLFEVAADGLLAICIQHEIDHLDGKVFVDYLSHLKRDRIKKKMRKLSSSK